MSGKCRELCRRNNKASEHYETQACSTVISHLDHEDEIKSHCVIEELKLIQLGVSLGALIKYICVVMFSNMIAGDNFRQS